MKKILCSLIIALTGLLFAENNKVFVVGIGSMSESLVQVNSKYPAVKSDPTGIRQDIVVGPVEVGSVFKYMNTSRKTQKKFELRSVVLHGMESVLQSEKSFIPTPNERKIFLFHQGNTVARIIEVSGIDAVKKSGMFKRDMRSPLKKALEQYKGTEWEPLLQAELEEWK